MKIQAIVAVAEDGGIGCRGSIPWAGEAPVDMKHFMNTTRNSIIIMGRVTADSLRLPLKNRKAIIITTKINETLERHGEHSKVVGSLDEALSEADSMVNGGEVPPDTNVFIIGGAQIYNAAMEQGLIDTMYLTTICGTFRADVFFHFDDSQYDLVSREVIKADEKNKYDCIFETFNKKES